MISQPPHGIVGHAGAGAVTVGHTTPGGAVQSRAGEHLHWSTCGALAAWQRGHTHAVRGDVVT